MAHLQLLLLVLFVFGVFGAIVVMLCFNLDGIMFHTWCDTMLWSSRSQRLAYYYKNFYKHLSRWATIRHIGTKHTGPVLYLMNHPPVPFWPQFCILGDTAARCTTYELSHYPRLHRQIIQNQIIIPRELPRATRKSLLEKEITDTIFTKKQNVVVHGESRWSFKETMRPIRRTYIDICYRHGILVQPVVLKLCTPVFLMTDLAKRNTLVVNWLEPRFITDPIKDTTSLQHEMQTYYAP